MPPTDRRLHPDASPWRLWRESSYPAAGGGVGRPNAITGGRLHHRCEVGAAAVAATPGTPADDPARGLDYLGRRRTGAAERCRGRFQTVPNLVVAKVGADGKVNLFNLTGSTHVVADVAGWF
ncbi:MAG: hypothetical protein ACRD2W_23065 [Acidimicrobiales bacterium]